MPLRVRDHHTCRMVQRPGSCQEPSQSWTVLCWIGSRRSLMSTSARILIVEDEPNVRLVFRAALVSKQYTLSTAEDGETALRYLGSSPVDLILLDLQMPRMGGMELLRRLRDSG